MIDSSKTRIGKRLERIKAAEEKLEKVKAKKISIDSALEDAPNLLKYLREKHGYLEVGKISSEPGIFGGNAEVIKESIEILRGNRVIGVYTREITPNMGNVLGRMYEGRFILYQHQGERRDEYKKIPFP